MAWAIAGNFGLPPSGVLDDMPLAHALQYMHCHLVANGVEVVAGGPAAPEARDRLEEIKKQHLTREVE